MKTIAIYGKGGIGKSTISSNISTTLADLGELVLQIGCDPKHDSTFMLTKQLNKVLLETFRDKNGFVLKEDVLTETQYGVDCIELGGPEPGIGCAGRGIIAGIDVINRLKIKESKDYDIVIYDTLGDVVCGGFFEPLRKGKTEEMYIVTSGEFNSLFAANNLIKGFTNNVLQCGNVHLKGIIGNCRGVKNEEIILSQFSKATGVPLLTIIPRDVRFEECSVDNMPIRDIYPDSDLNNIFVDLCNVIMEKSVSDSPRKSLSFDELRNLFSSIYRMSN